LKKRRQANLSCKISAWQVSRFGVFSPDRDKEARAHASSAMLEDGRIFYPSSRKWAKDLIDICAAFPAHPNDDVVDTCTQAWLRLRKGWFVGHSEDPEDDEFVEPKRITMYG
jgi:predicted phage terminase large subunit-like protein